MKMLKKLDFEGAQSDNDKADDENRITQNLLFQLA